MSIRRDITGSRRRLQALASRGWSFHLLEQLGGFTLGQLHMVAEHRIWISQANAERISELYEDLWNVAPPRDTRYQRTAASKAIARAQSRGWQPPMAWDDIDTDEGPAVVDREMFVDEILVQQVCNGGPGALNTLERVEAIRILNDRDLSDAAIAEIVRMNQRSVFRIRAQHGITAAVGADGMPVAS